MGLHSSTTIDCCTAFIESERIVKQIKRPFSAYVLRVVYRNIVIFLHTAIIFIPLLLVFHVKLDFSLLLAIPGLALVFANQVWIGIVVAILNSRFRDVLQMVSTAAQIFLFATPIMYPVAALGDVAIIAHLNPAYHLIEIVRAPLLGSVPALESWIAATGTMVVGYVLALLLFRRTANRIVYWL